ncbi:Uncharacterized protein dnm_093570 [Desulfonema magnum]|uniref:Uncharacterized protein n=1 Tax=Desulfonema magnum TaxID=45655 RepID=A0A975BWW6_9BACT|nr:Uncharacterized protein dnm_093570 [Desulfonema magnum]
MKIHFEKPGFLSENIFITRGEKPGFFMNVYMKVRSAKIKRSGFLQKLSCLVVTGRSWPFI